MSWFFDDFVRVRELRFCGKSGFMEVFFCSWLYSRVRMMREQRLPLGVRWELGVGGDGVRRLVRDW